MFPETYESEHLTRIRDLLPECALFLKRGEGFPLEKPGRIALYGSGVRHTVKGGTGSGDVYSRFYVTAEQGLRQAGFTILSQAWLDAYDGIRRQAEKDFAERLKREAHQRHEIAALSSLGAVMPEPEYNLPLNVPADTAVYVLARTSGEGSDRSWIAGDICLTRTEIRDILALNRQHKNFMLVLNTGGPVDLSPVLEINNILLLGQLGVETGCVLADILLGKVNPSGKLTATWAKKNDYCPIAEYGSHEDTHYYEGIYVGYRYFSTAGRKALFPFGFGLSYTDFSIGKSRLRTEGRTIQVEVSVTNTGHFPGRETLQLYVTKPEKKLSQPEICLAAFCKTNLLQPGEKITADLVCDLSELKSYDEQTASWILEAGEYSFSIGTNSEDRKPCGSVRLEEDIVISRVQNRCGTSLLRDAWMTRTEQKKKGILRAKPLVIPASVFASESLPLPAEPEIPLRIRLASDKELAKLNTGAYNPLLGPLSIIGNASTQVAGAAGETSHAMEKLGIPSLVMADGPAGLRLSPHFIRSGKKAKPTEPAVLNELDGLIPQPLENLLRAVSDKGRHTVVLDQYTTAIPIGTGLAQTWNPEAVSVFGETVAAEMERFGVDLWLAPAMNIQRNIRCGRNFEYYSEDPLLSGEIAAAMVRGVQSRPGCGAVIKHFAANNREENRYNNNSIVSERALREIYLRGFEICLRKSDPTALMTSYNLLNGVHTSENSQLLEGILRQEFGYKGVVMTDWIISVATSKKDRYPAPDAARIAAAGGNLVMPGSISDVRSILRGLENGTLTRARLEQNTASVLTLIRRLRD